MIMTQSYYTVYKSSSYVMYVTDNLAKDRFWFVMRTQIVQHTFKYMHDSNNFFAGGGAHQNWYHSRELWVIMCAWILHIPNNCIDSLVFVIDK